MLNPGKSQWKKLRDSKSRGKLYNFSPVFEKQGFSTQPPSSLAITLLWISRLQNAPNFFFFWFLDRFWQVPFFSVLTHHGCMSEVVRNSSNCNVCGVEYKVYKVLIMCLFQFTFYLQYGSLWDFFKRYFWQYTLLSLLVCSILVVSFICFIKPLKARTITLVHVCKFFLRSSSNWAMTC